MTSHYIDIQLLPDPEFSQPLLLGALYAKLHRALVGLESDEIGVAFPQYALAPRGLGSLLRLHGSLPALQRLMQTDWLRGMRDHISVADAQPVPAQAQHRQLQRRQFKSSVDRLRRRRMLRKGETPEQAEAAIPDSAAHTPDLPFVQLRSYSTNQTFCLFLALGDPLPQPVQGRFNAYGLSAEATIPWF